MYIRLHWTSTATVSFNCKPLERPITSAIVFIILIIKVFFLLSILLVIYDDKSAAKTKVS